MRRRMGLRAGLLTLGLVVLAGTAAALSPALRTWLTNITTSTDYTMSSPTDFTWEAVRVRLTTYATVPHVENSSATFNGTTDALVWNPATSALELQYVPPVPIPDTTPTLGALWHLDGSGADDLGGDNTVANTLTLISAGYIGSPSALLGTGALNLNGVNGLAWTNNWTSEVIPTDGVTVEAWVYVPDATGLTNLRTVVSAPGYSYGTVAYGLYLNNGIPGAEIVRTGVSAQLQVNGSNQLQVGRWYHLAMTYQGSGATSPLTLYVDGVPVNSVGGTGTLAHLPCGGDWCAPAIGTRVTSAPPTRTAFFRGYIDEVAISESALPAATIAAHATQGHYSPTAGSYTSASGPSIIDAGTQTDAWRTLAWSEGPVAPLGDPLPDTEAGLAALYHFDDVTGPTADDTGGTNGTPEPMSLGPANQAPLWSEGRLGASRALVFDGVDDYAYVPIIGGTELHGTLMAMEAWVKFNGLAGQQTIMFKRNTSGTVAAIASSGYSLYKQADNRLGCTVGNATTTATAVSTTAVVAGRWYHVACASTSAPGSVALFVNGGLENTVGRAFNPAYNATSHVYVGRTGLGGANELYLDGTLDELALYDGQASLTTFAALALAHFEAGARDVQMQVRTGPNTTAGSSGWTDWRPSAQLPNLTAPLDPATLADLRGLWHFDENAGIVANDGVGGTNSVNNLGTLGGGVPANTPVWVAGDAGFGTALQFDGNDHVAVPDGPEVRPTSEFSLGLRAKFLGGAGAFQYLASKTSSAPGIDDYYVFRWNTTLYCIVTSGGQQITASGSVAWQEGPAAPWYRILCTYDGRRLRVYVDGALLGEMQGVLQATPVFDAAALYLGSAGGSNGIVGLLDEVFLVHRAIEVNETFTASPANLDGVVARNRYAQYRALIQTLDRTLTPQLLSTDIQGWGYPTTSPRLINLLGQPFTHLTGFGVTPEPGTTGSITFQLSKDGSGGPWWWYNGVLGAWDAAGNTPVQSNPVSALTPAVMQQFATQVGAGTLHWRAFLTSDGDQFVGLRNVTANYVDDALSIIEPLANEVLLTGDPKTVRWQKLNGPNAAQELQLVAVDYDPSGDFSGPDMVTVLSGMNNGDNACGAPATFGCADWVIAPGQESAALGSGKIRVRGDDGPGTQAIFADSPGFSVVAAPAITAPVGGEVWTLGTGPHAISWSVSPAVGTVDLLYAPNGVTFSQTIATGLPPSPATYDWMIPAAGTNFLSAGIRAGKVRVVAHIGAQTLMADSLGFTVVRLDLDQPAGGEVWRIGTNGHTIAWTPGGPLGTVTLQYAPDGATFSKTLTTTALASDGSYAWNIPADATYIASGTDAGKIEISTVVDGVTVSDVSNGFSVTKPAFTITAPILNEVVGVSPPVYNVQWTSQGAPISSSLMVEYTTDGSTYTQACPGLQANDGTCNWIVPNGAASPTVRLRIRDTLSPFGDGLSDNFAVAGALTLLSPNTAGMKWAVGKAHNIQWTNTGAIRNVRIEFSKTGTGGPFAVLGTVATASPYTSGTFPWTPAVADQTTQAVIRLVDMDNPISVPKDSPVFSVTAIDVTKPACPPVGRCLVGSNQDITWTHTGLTNVKLSYSTGGPYVEIDPGTPKLASTLQYTWVVPDAVKKDTVTIRAEDADVSGEAMAEELSEAFTIYGQLQITAHNGGLPDWAVNSPQTIRWATPVGTIPQVRLQFSADGFLGDINDVTPGPVLNGASGGCAVNLGDTGCYVWTPLSAGSTMMVRVFDAQDSATVDESDGIFTIAGISVTAPVSGNVWAVGTSHLIEWDTEPAVSSGQVRLEYSTNGFADESQTVLIAAEGTPGLINAGTGGQYLWNPVADGISTNVRIRVTITDIAGLMGISQQFSIVGQIQVTSPNGGETLDVGQATSIEWNSVGSVRLVKIDLSKDGGATWPIVLVISPMLPAGVSGTGVANLSMPWTVPDEITHQARVRVSDNDPAHPPVSDASDGDFTIRSAFTINDPPASTGNGWGVFEIRPITWTTTGTVGQVTVEYSTDGIGWTVAQTDAGVPASAIANTGSFSWKVPDVVSPVVTAAGKTPGDGLFPHQVPTMQVRVRDVDPAHVGTARGEFMSPQFLVKWFRIKWVVKNGDTGADLAELNVEDTTVAPSWIVDNLNCAAGFTPCLSSPVYRHYPFGTYVTKWIKKDFTPNTVTGWVAVRDATAGSAGADAWDKVNPVSMTSSVPDPTIYQVLVEPVYNQATDTMTFKTWLEKQGQLPVDPTLFGPATIEIYNGLTLLQTLNATPPIDGSTGLPDVNWQKNYDFTLGPTGLTPGTIYFAKASITYEGRVRTSGGTVTLLIPSNQALTLADLQTELAPIGTQVGEIHTETVGPASTLGQLPAAIATAQTAIQADVAASQAAIQADVAGVQATADAIKAETDRISTQVIPKVDGVQAYLSDPGAGLPALQQQLTAVHDQTKALRRGGILNRDMELETSETAVLQYRSEGGVPALTVYDTLGAVVPGIPPLSLNAATGLYESTFALASLGEYRAVVTEPATADSAGTVDSVALTVRGALATAQDVGNLVTLLNTLDTKITTIDANLLGLMATAAAIQTTVDATKTQVDSIYADSQTLVGKWGALDAAALNAGITGLASALGTPPLGSSIAGELAAVRARTDTITWTDVTALVSEIGVGNIAAIRTKTDTIDWTDVTGLVTTTGQIQAKTDTINWADVTAIKTQTDTINWADVTALGTAVAQVQTDMAKEATLQTALTQVAAIQTGMAKDADLQTALGQLSALQTSLTALAGQVGTPAQQASLDAAITTLAAMQAAMATEVSVQNAIAAVAQVQTDMAKDADLQAALTQLGTVQTSLTALSAQVGNTAQQASLDAAIVLLNDIRTNMPVGGSDLSTVNAKLDALQASLDAVPTGDVDLTAVAGQLDGVEQTLAALQSEQVEADTLFTRLDALDSAIQSAEGSAAAVSFSQNAYFSANEALTILQQLQTEIRANGKSALAPLMLGKFGDKLQEVQNAITVIPGQLDTTALQEQVAQIAKQMQAVTSDKGYRFDSLYQMSEAQGGDVKAVRNHVQELKALVEVQKAILEQKLNEPVVKTWFEAGY